MKKIKRIAEKSIIVIYALLMLWIFTSWGEVISKNVTPNNSISDFNIFKMIIKLK